MKAPTLPVDEAERLDALMRFRVLDTPPEKAFDDLTWLASKVADTPIALVSLVDKGRQWFKSRQGLDAAETPREISFCGHAIHQSEPFIVCNALEDDRFCDNPLVISGPNIRFYAGFPLTTADGYKLGTLCVIDSKPQRLTLDQTEMLAVLARQTMSQLELRIASAELREEASKADQANQAKSLFLANMSHEIRTPMNAVIGMLDLTLSTALASDQRQQLQLAKESANALMRLLDDILDLSKVEANKLEVQSIPFRLAEDMSSLIETYTLFADQKGLDLSLDVDRRLPAALNGDPIRLRQVMINLVGNAVKFTESGSVTVSVRQETEEDGQIIVFFEVADTGAGIPADKREAIFEEFVQGDGSAARAYGGAGLGLAISSRLVGLMGGRIAVESEVDKGSVFRFSIPFQRSETQPDPQTENGGQAEAKTIPGCDILVVEDNRVNQLVASRTLEQMGHRVEIAANGKIALEILGRNIYDLILMDIQMPGLDGYQTTAAIRELELEQNRRTPIIAMTAHAMKGDRERCLAAGMDDYLAKPLCREAFQQAVAKQLSRN